MISQTHFHYFLKYDLKTNLDQNILSRDKLFVFRGFDTFELDPQNKIDFLQVEIS